MLTERESFILDRITQDGMLRCELRDIKPEHISVTYHHQQQNIISIARIPFRLIMIGVGHDEELAFINLCRWGTAIGVGL